MENDQKTLAVKQDMFTLAPRNLTEAMEYAKLIADTEMVPKDFRGKPGNILVAVQMGAELGLPCTQALQNIAVINGRPSLWGDAVLALVTASPECLDVIETDDGNTASCTIKRRGKSDVTRTFSVADAKTAGLFGKAGPWTQYPARMRQMRARSFAVRDAFPHLLRGIAVAEEVMDIPSAPRDITPGAEQKAEPKAPAQLPPYDQAKFDANLPAWDQLIKSGKKSADQVIKSVSTVAILTEEMKNKIKGCEVIEGELVPEDDGFFEDYDKAQQQGEEQ